MIRSENNSFLYNYIFLRNELMLALAVKHSSVLSQKLLNISKVRHHLPAMLEPNF